MPAVSAVGATDSIPNLFNEGGGNGDGSQLRKWSSLIGIITAIVGNVLIALALNVQRYSHIQLHRRKVENRERAKEAERRAQNGAAVGYGATDIAPRSAQNGEHEADDPLQPHSATSGRTAENEDESEDDEKEFTSTYLKSPLWWLGQVLMTVGESGNFLAYGFAPASIVSPLGVVALISNCVIAPIFFGEMFRKRDAWGVLVAIGGAVTVVLSAKQEEVKLEPHDVWAAITTMEFEIYMAVSITMIIALMWASPRYGNRTILIDLGLVGLFGAYTALTTKGVSSMLSSTFLRAFTTPVTYGLVIVLLGTAVMQVRYVNKALQRFDSTQVIPIQFVMFTLSVIIGSAVLYRDFERTSTEQALKFVGGCLLTFFGVFLITSGRSSSDDEDQLSDEEGVEETIGLLEQEASGPQSTKALGEHHRPPGSTRSSRRSSRTSRVSFVDTSIPGRPFSVQRDSGVPSVRRLEASTPRDSPREEAGPILENPWKNTSDGPVAAPLLPSAFSEDSVPTLNSLRSPSVAPTQQLNSSTSLPQSFVDPGTSIPPNQSPVTPRHSFSSSRPHSHHFSSNFISPSPLSSTVSAVVADALLRGEDAHTMRHSRSLRRLRPSIRASLFVPQDEEGEPHEGDSLLRSSAASDVVDGLPAEEQSRLGSALHPKNIKGRARSLSHTLGEFFGRKRGKRGEGSSEQNGVEDEDRVAPREGRGEAETNAESGVPVTITAPESGAREPVR